MIRKDQTYRFDVDNLFSSSAVPALTATFELEEDQGVLKRGSLMVLNSDGKGELIASGNTSTYFFVLSDDVDTTETTGCTGYLSGCFNKGALIVGEGYDFPFADVEEMRKENIILQDVMKVQEV